MNGKSKVLVWAVAVVAVVVLVGGCKPDAPGDGRKDVGAQELTTGTVGAGQRLKSESRELVAALKDFSYEKKDDLLKRMAGEMADMGKKIEELKGRAANASAEAREKLEKRIGELEKKRGEMGKRLDLLGKSTREAWGDLRKGMSEAYMDLSEAYEDARSHF